MAADIGTPRRWAGPSGVPEPGPVTPDVRTAEDRPCPSPRSSAPTPPPSSPPLLAQRILVLDGAMGTAIQRDRPDEAGYRGERFADWPSDAPGQQRPARR